MTISLKHAYQSAVPDSGVTSLVQPSNWNAEHVLTLATNKLVGRTTAGTGAAEEISVGSGLTLSAGTLSWNSTNPLLIGGATASSSLTLQSTSGVGTTDSILFKTGNNGATTALTIASNGNATFLSTSTTAIGTLSLTNALSAANGGTGQSSYTTGDLLYASSATALSKLASVAANSVLTSNGVGVAPGWTSTLTNITLSNPVEAVGASTYSIASQYDIGTGANQIPLNQFLGTMAYQDAASVNVGRLTVTGQSTKTITVPVASNGSTAVPSETSLIGAWFYTGSYEAGIYSINTYNSDFGNGLLFKTTNTTGTTAERMRIDSSGNVGIGTSSPTQKLTVFGNGLFSGGYVYAAGGGQGFRVDGVIIADRDQDFGITLIGGVDNTLRLRTGNTTRATIDSSGNVGIGTTSPASKLNVVGGNVYIQSSGTYSEPAAIAGILAFDTINGDLTISSRSNGGNTIVRFFTSNAGTGAERMRIDSSGNMGIGTSSPSGLLELRKASPTTLVMSHTNGTGYEATISSNYSAGESFSITTNAQKIFSFSPNALSGAGAIILGAANNITRINGNIARLFFASSAGTDLVSIRSGTGSVNDLEFYTNSTERMRIDSSGNVGIGTSTLNAALTISRAGVMARFQTGTASDGRVEWAYNTTDIGYIGADTSTEFSVWARSGNLLKFGAGGTERMRIDSSGNVGIGTSSPTTKLDVVANDAIIRISDSSSNTGTGPRLQIRSLYGANDTSAYLGYSFFNSYTYLQHGRSGLGGISFNSASGTIRMYIEDSSGNVGIGTTSPTSRLTVAGPAAFQAPSTKTANYSMVATDSALIFNGAGSITLTLQAASSYTGRMLYVKTIAAQTVVSASSNVVPIDSATAGTAILAATAGKWAILQSDGTNWVVIASN